MNDTIVVFDRIRENLATSRREGLADVVNRSINQTLSRTVLTSGLTFLTVLSLFFFGGEVLHPFSFALVVGILIGTYSSIAVAAPMLVAYQQWRASRTAALPAAKGRIFTSGCGASGGQKSRSSYTSTGASGHSLLTSSLGDIKSIFYNFVGFPFRDQNDACGVYKIQNRVVLM
jgi:predicted RND superfamily exporter protein